MYERICMNVYVNVRPYMYVCMYIRTYVCMYVCMYVSENIDASIKREKNSLILSCTRKTEIPYIFAKKSKKLR